MILSAADRALVAALQGGLAPVARPYLKIAESMQLSEAQVIERVRRLVESGVIKRFGIVVYHRAFGYVHNAMVVWDVDDACVDDVGERMSRFDFVTLCYRRPRRPPRWPYNLFCMIHGRDRSSVGAQVETLTLLEGLESVRHEVLFSRRCFKQRGARYVTGARAGEHPAGIEPAHASEGH
ncbi:MAG: siroheme decarboxylase subunit beta [Gammaproteobacteria bacterium]